MKKQTLTKINLLFQIAYNMRSRHHNTDPFRFTHSLLNSQSSDSLHPPRTAENMCAYHLNTTS
jgi:hypothetical protein